MTNYPNDPNQPGGYGEQQPNDGSGGSQPYGSPQQGGQYGAQPYGSPQYGAQPYGSPQYGAPQYGAPQAPVEHKKSVLVLVLGILSIPTVFCYIGLVLGIIAVVMGRKTLQEIDASGGTIGGRGKAQAGFICGIIGTVLSIVIIVLAIIGLATRP